MIVIHHENIAAIPSNHQFYWLPYQVISYQQLSASSTGAPSVTIIAQARTVDRFVFSRIFGRVN